jgi:hypothetical protein
MHQAFCKWRARAEQEACQQSAAHTRVKLDRSQHCHASGAMVLHRNSPAAGQSVRLITNCDLPLICRCNARSIGAQPQV